ncbi:coiled-coil domain-containing protein 97 [Alosa sapidissima]|uniref:coiled-coil domain-containing protein 97 n=1 Tax=Alosa sapidissima TaxID=34773 RepID=UPI001C0820F2|nr:coiled-coil domain-containing protein 97 [Alosa sapidissima]
MWGEIEPESSSLAAEKSSGESGLTLDQSSTCSRSDSKGSSSGNEGCPSPNKAQSPAKCEHPTCFSDMIEAVAVSGSPVKSQQIGDPDLTLEERGQILLELYETKPLVFLERYQAHLKPEHLDAFSHVSGDFRAQHYFKEVQRRAGSQTNRTRVRNHRYAALRALQKEGQYFSEEQMRIREPLLYEQYIGQYLSEEEIFQRSQDAMQRGPGGLADLLIDSYQERVLQGRLQEQQEEEDCAQEEDDEEEEDGHGRHGEQDWEPNAQEKALLKEEFVSQMQQRFLDGKDKDFNYSEVDDNPDYDNLDIVSRDAEDRYFDDDDDEEDEDDTDMIQ